jgi:hypothetical protein
MVGGRGGTRTRGPCLQSRGWKIPKCFVGVAYTDNQQTLQLSRSGTDSGHGGSRDRELTKTHKVVNLGPYNNGTVLPIRPTLERYLGILDFGKAQAHNICARLLRNVWLHHLRNSETAP